MFLFSRLMSKAPQVLTTFLIFSLSAGVLGGILFYMDSVGPNVLNDLTQNLDVDMEVSISPSFYRQNETELSAIEDLLNQQELVTNIEPLSIIDQYAEFGYYYEWRRIVLLGVEMTFFDTFPNVFDIGSDALDLADNGCYLRESIFLTDDYDIGDNYTIEIITYDEYYQEVTISVELEILGTFTTDLFTDEYYPYYYAEIDRESSLDIITTKDTLNEGFGELGYGQYNGISEKYWVRLDRSSIIQGEPTEIEDRLVNLRRQFEQDALPLAMVSNFGLLNSLFEYTSWAMGMTALALSFSIPSIIMGVLLIYYNSNLMNDELRRDVGTIKTRGASGWQAFSWILTSAIVTGILGSLGAVLMGALAALLSVTVKTFFVFDLTQLFDLTMTFHPNAIVTIFTFAFGVGIIVAIPVAVRAYLMTATEAHNILERESLLSQENLGSPMVELLALALSGYILVPTMTILGFFGFLSFMSLSFLIWLVPLLAVFIIAFARLAARPTSRFKSGIMEMIKKPSFRVGTQVMARTVLMYKKSEAMGVVFVAMVFTAGVFSSLSATTGYNHMVSVHKFYTGADFAITVDGSLSNVTLDLLENLTTVEGVSKVCPVFKVQGSIQYWTSEWTRRVYRNESILVYAVDLEKWKDTAFWLQYFTLLSTPENAISQMIENETNVLASFQPIDHYIQSGFYQTPVYGNAITLTLKGESWTNVSDMNIVDVMSNSQGSGQTYLPGEADSSRFVVVDLDYVHRCLNTTKINKFLVRMDLEANYTEVMRNLWEVAPYSFEGIESPYTEIDRVLDSKAGQSIYGIYTINVLFTIIYLSIGMMIVSTVRVRGLRKQFAVMRALGTESKSIKSAVLIDTTLSLLVAAGIGSLIGLMLSYFAINMPLVYFGTGTLSMWIRLPVFIAVPWLLLGAILALSCTFALAATYVVTSAALRKNIAEQIQYTE